MCVDNYSRPANKGPYAYLFDQWDFRYCCQVVHPASAADDPIAIPSPIPDSPAP